MQQSKSLPWLCTLLFVFAVLYMNKREAEKKFPINANIIPANVKKKHNNVVRLPNIFES